MDPVETHIQRWIVLLIFALFLNVASYFLLKRYIKSDSRDQDTTISFVICTFSLSVVLFAALLVPASVAAKEFVLIPRQHQPDLIFQSSFHYYFQWVSQDLIDDFWEKAFWGINVCIFVLLPFAFFFEESFSGSPHRGIMNRIRDTLAVWLLVISLIWLFVYLLQNLYNFAFSWSVTSLIGSILFLIFTPLGWVKEISTIQDLSAPIHFRAGIADTIYLLDLEITASKSKLKQLRRRALEQLVGNSEQILNFLSTSCQIETIEDLAATSIETIRETIIASTTSDTTKNSSIPLLTSRNRDVVLQQRRALQGRIPSRRASCSVTIPFDELFAWSSFSQKEMKRQRKILLGKSIDKEKAFSAESQVNAQLLLETYQVLESIYFAESERHKFDNIRRLPILYGAIFFIFTSCLLFFELVLILRVLHSIFLMSDMFGTIFATLLTDDNTPKGNFGAALDLFMVLQFMCCGFIGFYSSSFVSSWLSLKRRGTPIPIIIINIAFFLAMSSSLPLLSRILRLTYFDLMNDFTNTFFLRDKLLWRMYSVIFLAVTLATVLRMYPSLFSRRRTPTPTQPSSVNMEKSTSVK